MKSTNTACAVMLHHFHDGKRHPRSQGSIDAGQFAALLDHLRTHRRLLSAPEFLERALTGALGPEDTCLTFDDALLAQYEIAVPVLDAFDLKAFFFIYTSIFTDQPDRLEIYRDFRTLCFEDVGHFYRDFFALFERRYPTHHATYKTGYPRDYLAAYAFYTEDDRRFRYVRDQVLTADEYDTLMDALIRAADYPLAERQRRLWMGPEQVAELAETGHEIGLHSHSHPLRMERLDPSLQAEEYALNQRMLTEICGRSPRTMSHPCGSYGADTLAILEGMGMRLGFRSSPDVPGSATLLELPREDHAELMARVA